MSAFDSQMAELSSAEDFLQFFGIDYDPHVVSVNRLHILKRCNQYLQNNTISCKDDSARHAQYHDALKRAYDDFVHSNAQTEKVFPIFRRGEAFVPLAQVRRPEHKGEERHNG